MLHLYFSVVPFEKCVYLYQMYLVKYHPQTFTINFIANNMQEKTIDISLLKIEKRETDASCCPQNVCMLVFCHYSQLPVVKCQ